jgi:hypothetical protein
MIEEECASWAEWTFCSRMISRENLESVSLKDWEGRGERSVRLWVKPSDYGCERNLGGGSRIYAARFNSKTFFLGIVRPEESASESLRSGVTVLSQITFTSCSS